MDSKKVNDILAARTGRSQEEVARLLAAFAGCLSETIKEGDSVAIPSVGLFEPKKKLERVALHPATGRKILVPPKLSIVFKPSALLKQKLRDAQIPD